MPDLLRYLLACLLFVAAGTGVIRLLRVRIAPDVALLLGASITLGLLPIVLGIGVIAGRPLAQVTMPAWIALLGLAVYGVRGLRLQPEMWRRVQILLGVSLLAAPLVMLPYFLLGLAEYPGSGLLDDWSYVSLGSYLWTYPRGTEGGLAVVHQFAVPLAHTRYASAALLGFFSGISSPGDTQAATGVMRAVCIFSAASASAAFARVRGLDLRFASLYVAMAAISGWVFDIILINNYDQGLALPYFPALATLATLLPDLPWAGAILMGAVAAGAIFTYPELAVVAVVIAGLLALEAVLRRRAYSALLRGGVVLLAAAVFSLPYWRDLSRVLDTNWPRPGPGMFLGLLDSYAWLSALFALGGEWRVPDYLPLTTRFAGVLLVLCAIGVMRLLRRAEIGVLLAVAGLGGMTWVLLVRQNDAYAAYETLALGWWLTAWLAINGIVWVHDLLVRLGKSPWVTAVVLGLLVPVVTVTRAFVDVVNAPRQRMSDYRAVERLPHILGEAPMALIASDIESAHWAAYFLRQADVLVGEQSGYLGAPPSAALIARARQPAVERIRFVITDVRLPNAQALGWRTVWGNGQLAAWDTAPTGWTTVSGITDAVGHARPANATFRAGAAGATLQVLSSRAGIAALGLNLGDSLGPGERSCWELTLTPSGGMPPHAVRLRPGGAIVDVPVPAGRSTIGLRASPLVPTPASVNASAREAIFNNLTVRLQPTAPAIATDGTRPAASVQAPCEGS